MKLSLNIPTVNRADFAGVLDFQVVDLDIYDIMPDVYYGIPSDMEVWLNRTTLNLLERYLSIFLGKHKTVRICNVPGANTAESFKSTLKLLYRLGYYQELDIIGVWDQDSYDISQLDALFPICAMPWFKPRSTYLKTRDRTKWAYFGFTNLSEIATLTPGWLHTAMPIMAAYYGISLLERVRRPKNLEFAPNIKLNTHEIDLALTNIQAIKEAAAHGQDPSLPSERGPVSSLS